MEQYERLRTEIQHLRQEVRVLKKQIAQFQHVVREQDKNLADGDDAGAAVRSQRSQRRASEDALYKALPSRFTIEDLISIAEEMSINVFQAYQDLQVLIAAERVAQYDDVFEKAGFSGSDVASPLPTGAPHSASLR